MHDLNRWAVAAFYRFFRPSEPLESLRISIRAEMARLQMMGLVIVAPEGINGTVAGSADSVAEFKSFLDSRLGVGPLRYKDSVSDDPPFHRLTVVVRSEIVGMKRPDLVPESEQDHHLEPSEWHAMLASDRPPLVIDTRNDYETKIGKFRGAVDPDIRKFSDWGAYLQTAGIPREDPVLIYCTGGIRCEKAILEMRAQGYDHVYQLRDGILGYLAEYPEGLYEGECYVFDDRVAVDAHLQPTSRYGNCPGCGMPAERANDCQRCGSRYAVCGACAADWPPVCSKTCADRYRRHGPASLVN